jgi:hypothetical protein
MYWIIRPLRWAEVQQSLEALPFLGLANQVMMFFHRWLLNQHPFLGLAIIVLDNCGLDDPHDLDAPLQLQMVSGQIIL